MSEEDRSVLYTWLCEELDKQRADYVMSLLPPAPPSDLVTKDHLSAELGTVRKEIADFRVEMVRQREADRAEAAALRVADRAEFAQFRDSVQTEFADLRIEMVKQREADRAEAAEQREADRAEFAEFREYLITQRATDIVEASEQREVARKDQWAALKWATVVVPIEVFMVLGVALAIARWFPAST